jgi:hypothetical protein
LDRHVQPLTVPVAISTTIWWCTPATPFCLKISPSQSNFKPTYTPVPTIPTFQITTQFTRAAPTPFQLSATLAPTLTAPSRSASTAINPTLPILMVSARRAPIVLKINIINMASVTTSLPTAASSNTSVDFAMSALRASTWSTTPVEVRAASRRRSPATAPST